MSETDQPITQKQNSLIWEGLQVFRKLPEWMTAAWDPGRLCAAPVEALELFILILHAWTKIKVRELNDIMFVLEHFLPAYKILNLK
jgi:hypothetical protein